MTQFGLPLPRLSNPKFSPPKRPIVRQSPPANPIVELDPSTWPNWFSVALVMAEKRGELRGYERGLAVAEGIARSPDEPPRRSMQEIAEEVAIKHGYLNWRAFRARRRNRELVHARQEAMARIAKETDYSLAQIGAFFGGYDHSTVFHAIQMVEKREKLNVG